MANFPQIMLGTYEQFLLGYEFTKDENKEMKLNLTMASRAHLGSIRSISVNKQFLASAGADEYVNVFSMISRKEVAVLTPHEGTITRVLFTPDGTHLVSGSQDGNISIFRCTDWTLMKAWKGAHKKSNGIIDMSIHPTGKLLLSIGADHIMRVWNMVKGRQAYAVNFGKKVSIGNTLNFVRWSHDGGHYAVTIGNTAYVYDTSSSAVVYAANCESRISCIDLSMGDLLCVGRDDGKLEIHSYRKQKILLVHDGHENRIKCLTGFTMAHENHWLASADSKGVLRVWKLEENGQKITRQAEANADCRVLCMDLLHPEHLLKEEKKDHPKNEVAVKKKILSVESPKTVLPVSASNGDAVTFTTASTKTLDQNNTPKSKKKKKSMVADELESATSSGVPQTTEETPSPSKTPNKKRTSSNFITTEYTQPRPIKRKSFSTGHWNVS